MLKQFTYNVSVIIQNRITGKKVTLTNSFNGDVEVNEVTYFGEFLLADDEPIVYVQNVLSQYCTDNNISLNDLDLIRFEVASDDPDVVVYFQSNTDTQILVDRPIYAYIQNPMNYLTTPTLVGVAISPFKIQWTWNEIVGCAYEIYNANGEVIRTVGVGITDWEESGLTADTNYTRAIRAYNDNSISELGGYITVHTPEREVNPDLVELNLIPEREVDLKPIPIKPNKSTLFKSGIGHGDDLKVSLLDTNSEVFNCTATIQGYDSIDNKMYPDVVFQYRQKSSSKIERESKFGKFEYEIYRHFKEDYSVKVNAAIDSPVDIQRDASIRLRSSAIGPAIIEKKFKYKTEGIVKDIPINVKRDFNCKLGVEYDTSFDFDYQVKADAVIGTESSPTLSFDMVIEYYKFTKERFTNSWEYYIEKGTQTVRASAIDGQEVTVDWFTGQQDVSTLSSSNFDVLGISSIKIIPLSDNTGSYDTSNQSLYLQRPYFNGSTSRDSSMYLTPPTAGSWIPRNYSYYTNGLMYCPGQMYTNASGMVWNELKAKGTYHDTMAGMLFINYTRKTLLYGSGRYGVTFKIKLENDPGVLHMYSRYLNKPYNQTNKIIQGTLLPVQTPTFSYIGLKSYNKFQDIAGKSISQLLTESLSGQTVVSFKNINSISSNPNVTLSKEVNLLLRAMNTVPDNYYTEFDINNSIYSITNSDGKSLISVDQLKTYRPKNGNILYDGTDYEKFKYTIKNINNTHVSVGLGTADINSCTGPQEVVASTSSLIGDYKMTATFDDSIFTELDKTESTKTIADKISTIFLMCNSVQPGGTVSLSDRIYVGDMSNITYTLTRITGDVTLEWGSTSDPSRLGAEPIIVKTQQYIGEYVKDSILTKYISSEAGSEVLIATEEEIEACVPEFNGMKWTFGINFVTHKILENKPSVTINFSNGTKEVIGPYAVVASPLSNVVQFRKTIVLSGPIYAYECPKKLIDMFDIIPEDSIYGKYTGDMKLVNYTLTDKSIGILFTVEEDEFLMADIENKKERVLIDSKTVWCRSNSNNIDYTSAEYPTGTMYELIKIGGHSNTIGSLQGEKKQVKAVGDKTYSLSGNMLLYSNKAVIELDDITYSQWKVGIVNENGKNDLTIPVVDLVKNAVSEITNELEFDNKLIEYTVNEDGTFTIFSNYSVNTSTNVLDPNAPSVDAIVEGINVNIDRPTTFEIEIENPKLSMPDKKFILRLASTNPNVDLSTELDPNDIGDDPTIIIPVKADVSIDSQTPWKIALKPGYYYLSTSEHYLFGATDINVDNKVDNTYTLSPAPQPGSPIVVKDIEGNLYREIYDGLEIEEEVEVVNKRYLYTKYTGIDLSTLYIDDEQLEGIVVVNNIVILPTDTENDKINMRYKVYNSFHVGNENDNSIEISVHGGTEHNFYYETSDKYIATNIDINPLRSLRTSGFLYIKE